MPLAPHARTRWIVAAVVVATASVALWIDQRAPYYHWVEVVPRKVYRSGTLEGDLPSAIDRFALRTVLNLRSVAERSEGDWYASEREVTQRMGVRLVDLPIEPGMPPSPQQVALLLELFDDPTSTPLLLHCQHGVTRSAAVEALYRREYLGESGEEALEAVRNLKPDLPTKYPAIAEFIRTYVPRARSRP
jgi:protein-tyrosine phosphatase